MSMANAVIHGNIGQDATLKELASGTVVLNFSVAVSEKRKEGKEITTWWDCSMFGDRAKALADHLTKGTGVVLVGKPGARAYTNKSDEAVAVPTLLVNDLSFAGGSKAEGGKPEKAPAPTQYNPWGGG